VFAQRGRGAAVFDHGFHEFALRLGVERCGALGIGTISCSRILQPALGELEVEHLLARRRLDDARPVMTRRKAKSCSRDRSFQAEYGRDVERCPRWSTPLPKCWRSFFFAEVKRALRTASTRW